MSFDILGFVLLVGLGTTLLSGNPNKQAYEDDECDCDEDDCICDDDDYPVKRQIQPVKPPRKKGKRKVRRLL